MNTDFYINGYEAAIYRCLRAISELYPTVPWPNDWEGPEEEQLIFGKGMVAGAKAASDAVEAVMGAAR